MLLHAQKLKFLLHRWNTESLYKISILVYITLQPQSSTIHTTKQNPRFISHKTIIFFPFAMEWICLVSANRVWSDNNLYQEEWLHQTLRSGQRYQIWYGYTWDWMWTSASELVVVCLACFPENNKENSLQILTLFDIKHQSYDAETLEDRITQL